MSILFPPLDNEFIQQNVIIRLYSTHTIEPRVGVAVGSALGVFLLVNHIYIHYVSHEFPRSICWNSPYRIRMLCMSVLTCLYSYLISYHIHIATYTPPRLDEKI